jgi:hypothetical protein
VRAAAIWPVVLGNSMGVCRHACIRFRHWRHAGDNFPTSGSVRCRFGAIIVPGVIVSNGTVQCAAPRQDAGSVTVEVAFNSTGTFTSNGFRFQYTGACPPNCFGANAVCLFGTCACRFGWTGPNCTVQLVPPVFTIASAATATEMQPFALNVSVSGSTPMAIALQSGPDGMQLQNNQLLWQTPVVADTPYAVLLVAENALQSTTFQLLLTVQPSYTLTVDALPSAEILLPRTVVFTGRVQAVPGLVNPLNIAQGLPLHVR